MTEYKENNKAQITDFTKYPREFVTYKWYRPLLTLIAFWIVFILLANVLTISIAMINGREYSQAVLNLTGGYDDFNVYSGPTNPPEADGTSASFSSASSSVS